MNPVHTPEAKISDYGLIGNCRTAALISRFGSLDWCCLPRFDSQSFFSSILDREKGGHFVIQPLDEFESFQEYIKDTNILSTTFKTKFGTAVLSDCFTVSDNKSEYVPQHEILRILRGIDGLVRIRVNLIPRSHYGAHPVKLKRIGHWGLECARGRKLLLLQSDLPISLYRIDDKSGVSAEFTIRNGESVAFSLVYSDTAPAVFPLMGIEARNRESKTVNYWKLWSSKCSYRGEYQNEVLRSALTLKLLSFAPSGAIIASPTTSLPEWLNEGRNWDYRYCWLRDAAFTVRSLAKLGYFEEAKAYLDWLLHATRLTHPRLKVVYSVYGESRLRELTVNHLSGYMGSQPVRIGNQAWNQLQLDIYGEVLDAAHFLLPHWGTIDHETRKFLTGIGKAVIQLWNQPDDGIWETRSVRLHHTHSKVMAWVALNRLQDLANKNRWKLPIETLSVQNSIRHAIEQFGFKENLGYYTKSFQTNDLDSSLLVMPLVGYTHAASSRFQGTLQAIQQNLSKNGLLYRYHPATDGMKSTEGAFLICNFWLAAALAHAGQIDQAKIAVRSVLDRMNNVGLLSEEMNPENGEYLGNYPQGFSHIGLINAALTIMKYDQKRRTA